MATGMDMDAFEKLSDRQQEFLLAKMTDPETGIRYFEISPNEARQVWFEGFCKAGWVAEDSSSDARLFTNQPYMIAESAWPILVETKKLEF